MARAAEDDIDVTRELVEAHLAEIEARGSEVTNLGWGTDLPDCIASKTNYGILDTCRCGAAITHKWS